ncbi:MAG: NAD(P)-dependent oxidoreductase, partial [Vicinamibacterales bacterium]
RNLVAAGYTVHGYDISADALAAAATDGVISRPDPAALADACDLVLTMVWDDASLRNALFGSRGLLEARRTADCTVDLSTTSVHVAREAASALEARGGAFLDGAVIGGGVAAVKAGRSPIVMGGDRAMFDRYVDVFRSLGTCVHVGALGSAKVVKIVNNLLVGVLTAANAEALSLGVSLGLNLKDLLATLRAGPGTSRVLESYMGSLVERGDYGEGLIGHRLMAKDLQLAAELAESLGLRATYPRLAQQMYLTFGRELGMQRPFPSAFDYFRAQAADVGRRQAGTASAAA